MYWPDTNTVADVEPARKPVASAVRKFFTEGGPGVPPTVPGGDWFNQITSEILNVLAAAGIDPSKTDDDQLLQAINGISKALSAREALRRTFAEAGYTLRPEPESFKNGGTLTSATDVLLDENSGLAYAGVGPFPQEVPEKSAPTSEFIDKSGELLRTRVGSIAANATHITDVPGIDLSGSVNNRTVIFAVTGQVFIPAGMSVRCNLLPDDDVTKFVGEGKISTQDPWGYEHVFDVALARRGSKFTAFNVINQHARTEGLCRVGIIGDSITDGAYGTGWAANPLDVNGDLASTNYDHNDNGGAGSWFRTFTDWLNRFTKNDAFVFKAENCGSSGKRLIDGWANRNFDHGFFKNTSYGNTAPDVCFISMGVNDNGPVDTLGFDEYLFRFEQFIRKAQGYGCAVCLVSMNQNGEGWGATEAGIKKHIERLFPSVEFLDLSQPVSEMYRDVGSYTLADIAKRPTDGTFDYTHYAPLGHQYVGAYAAMMVMPYRVHRAKIGGNFLPVSPNDVQPFGFPSGSVYPVNMETLSGNSYLNGLSGWGVVAPTAENITIRYFVWCDNADISMTVFEPFNPTYGAAGRANTISIKQQDNRNASWYSAAIASNGLSSFTNKLTTRVGTMKKGLNQVEIVYDGSPSKVYPPALLFRGDLDEFATHGASVFLGAGAVKGVYGQIRNKADLLAAYGSETANDEAPDMYAATKSSNVQAVTLTSLPVDCAALFYYKPSSQSGVVARRVATGIEISTMLFGAFTVVGTLVCDVTGEVTLTAGLAAGVPTITVKPTTGGTQQQAVAGFSGGKISLINRGATGQTVTVKSAAQYIL